MNELKIKALPIGFLASRNGSSMRAIVNALQTSSLQGDARVVVSNNRKAPALGFAAEHGIEAVCIPTQGDANAADAKLLEVLDATGVELVVLSGYLRRLGPRTLGRFHNRVLNIHPGPLPQFGGDGMYGRRVHEAVIDAGVPMSGMSIHLVDEEYDRGQVLATRSVPVTPGETVDSLEAKITAQEPAFFVETLQRIVSGSIMLPGS